MVNWKFSPNIKSQVVLAISKDEETLNLWMSFFKEKNYRIICEGNPKDGLQTSHLFDPALILVDLDLPQPEYLKFCNALRATTNGAIILLAPRNKNFDISNYYHVGVNEFIATPANPMAVLIKSITWLARQEWATSNKSTSQVFA